MEGSKAMKVYIVYEYMVAEYEEYYRVMSVHSTEAKAKEAIAEYEEIANKWIKCRAEYEFEECEMDRNYYED